MFSDTVLPDSFFALPDLFSAAPRASCSFFMFCAPGLVFGGTEGVGFLFHVFCVCTHFRSYRGCRVPFSCFACSNSFAAVSSASGPVFMFCALVLIFSSIEGVGPVFIFCAPALVFSGTVGVGSRFHVFRSRTTFWRYRGPRVPSFFFTPGHVFGDIEGVGSRFHVLRAQTRFLRYRGRQVPFSCFACTDSFSAVPRASGPVLMFCTPGLVFGGTEDVGFLFHILRTRTHFWRYRGRPIPFSCFARLQSFSAIPRASDPGFMLCAPGLVFSSTEGVGSHFHVLPSRTRFWRYLGRRVTFSCFALPDSFLAVQRASGPVFMFCSPGLIFDVIEGVGSRFHVLRARTRFWF
jgi:hypothetical protein